ncbi:MAG TPA: hypothetical protein DEB09_04060 [Candidatus Magasanikbacteria bacterium]|nr:hypothetical protein [Candidatus Magasanikbacteria bacterium]
MNLLWLTWKDKKNPLAGGAEVVNEELAKRLVADGHQVIFLVGGFAKGMPEEIINGYKVVRLGNRWSVYWQVYKYYKKNFIGWADLVIDEINTIPFFAKYYIKEKNILFVHQLCRKIWFYQIFFPLNVLGYILEPFYLWLLRDRKVITVSQSTKNDLLKYGFKKENVNIISEGIEIESVGDLKATKYPNPTILSLGAIRAMKRTDNIIKAFEMAKEKIKDLELVVAGTSEGEYGKKILKMIEYSKFKDSIKYLGKVSNEEKLEKLQKAHLFVSTSIKEGWGLVVTEANSQGTPAIVYNVDGLRDAVKNHETGIICERNTPENLAKNIVELLEDKIEYEKLRMSAWEWSKEINFENSYQDFVKNLN